MDTKKFGSSGVAVPVVGQGTWRMGEHAGERAREIAALRLGIELGVTHIDTAEMYGSGGAEEIIREAIRGTPRDRLFLASKVLPENASRAGTIRAAERSLRRLGTDYLDLYLLHWPGRHAIADTIGAMEDLVAEEKIRFFGVSNFDVDELRAAVAATKRYPLSCNQVLYHLGSRGIERELIPYCKSEGIAVVGYTPFGKGRAPSGERLLARIGARHGKTVHQVVLGFLTRAPGVFAIPKAVAPDHVRENAGATGFALDEDEIRAIDREFPAPKRRVPLATA